MDRRHLVVIMAAAIVLALQFAERERAPLATRNPQRATLKIAVLGDSVAHGAGDESDRGGIAGRLGAANFGIDGARTFAVMTLLERADVRAVLRGADVVVLSIGGNDLYGDTAARLTTLVAPGYAIHRTIHRIAAIVTRIHGASPSARVVLLGLYDPYRTPWLDEQVALWDSALIAHFARDAQVDVVRIADLFAYTARLSPIDRFHPSAAGYALIAARIASTW